MPKTEADFPLTVVQMQALLQLAVHTYQKQAHVCYDANAPLAGCIMEGAAVEAILTMVTRLLYDEAVKSANAPKRKLLQWSFFELLTVAKELQWLPEELTLATKLDSRTVKTPVRTDYIREVRNLVHPARYLRKRIHA
jgi:hypothetical protein